MFVYFHLTVNVCFFFYHFNSIFMRERNNKLPYSTFTFNLLLLLSSLYLTNLQHTNIVLFSFDQENSQVIAIETKSWNNLAILAHSFWVLLQSLITNSFFLIETLWKTSGFVKHTFYPTCCCRITTNCLNLRFIKYWAKNRDH